MLEINLESTLIALIEDQVTPSLTKTESFLLKQYYLVGRIGIIGMDIYPGKPTE